MTIHNLCYIISNGKEPSNQLSLISYLTDDRIVTAFVSNDLETVWLIYIFSTVWLVITLQSQWNMYFISCERYGFQIKYTFKFTEPLYDMSLLWSVQVYFNCFSLPDGLSMMCRMNKFGFIGEACGKWGLKC